MDLFKIIKNNSKIYIMLGVIILLGTIGITYSLIVADFNAIGINTTSIEIDANITYNDNSNGAEIISNGNMLPIDDELVDIDVTDTRVLKATFNVSGVDSNPDNTIYDIALHDIDIDCDLRTTDLKWRLYKDDTLLSEGNLSPTFDTMAGNRLVLTNTQQDLSSETDSYTFLLWISETCTGDITECDSSMDQSKYLNQTFSASIKLELSTKSKKELVRVTGEEKSCEYTEVDIPVCNNLTYNGSSHVLVNESSNYKLINDTGVNAGTYAVTLDLVDGYKWSNGSTGDKVISCSINKKNVTVTALEQEIDYGGQISNTIDDVTVDGLIDGHSLSSIFISSSIVTIGTGNVKVSNAVIVDSDGNDVTNNYNIRYINGNLIIS